ncbi:unnamed protein product, partial [Urochloa humidicola]
GRIHTPGGGRAGLGHRRRQIQPDQAAAAHGRGAAASRHLRRGAPSQAVRDYLGVQETTVYIRGTHSTGRSSSRRRPTSPEPRRRARSIWRPTTAVPRRRARTRRLPSSTALRSPSTRPPPAFSPVARSTTEWLCLHRHRQEGPSAELLRAGSASVAASPQDVHGCCRHHLEHPKNRLNPRRRRLLELLIHAIL